MANVYLVKNKEQRVLGGHPWVFRSDIESVEGAHVPGGVVRVMSSRHKFLGACSAAGMKASTLSGFTSVSNEQWIIAVTLRTSNPAA